MNTINKNAGIFLVIGILALAGCSTTPGGGGDTPAFTGPAAPAATRLTLLAVDRSKSTEGIRSQLLQTAFDVGTNFDKARDTMYLYRFGNGIEEVYSELPQDDDDFALVLTQYVKDSDPVPGTDYPHVLERLANDASTASEAEIRILIVGDAKNDFANDPGSEKTYRNAAERLSQNPRIKWVRFWGADVGTREELRSVFKPLGPKLQILSLDQNPLAP